MVVPDPDMAASDVGAAVDRGVSPSVSTSEVSAILRLRATGGALGSRGFLGLRALGCSVPSGAVLGLTTEPGLRPGFFRGTPAAVS